MNNQQASEWIKEHYEDIAQTCKDAGIVQDWPFEPISPSLGIAPALPDGQSILDGLQMLRLGIIPIDLPERDTDPRGVYSEAEAARSLFLQQLDTFEL